MRVDEASFVAAVEEAMTAGMVTLAPGSVYQFTHELTRSAVCASLSVPRAGLLHGTVADALRAVDPAVMQSRPYVVAEHLASAAQLGGRPERYQRRRAPPGTPPGMRSPGLRTRRRSPGISGSLELVEHIPAYTQWSSTRIAPRLWPDDVAGWPSRRQGHAAPRRGPRAGCHRPDLIIAAALAADRGFFSITGAADEQRIGLLSEAREPG